MKWILTLAMMVTQAYGFELEVNVENIRSDRGNIKIALFKGGAGFPGKYQNAYATDIIEIDNRKAQIVFRGLVEGEYAIALFHDENNNNDLDTRFRIPREPFGFSNNPSLLGPPKYYKCRFTVNADTVQNIYLKKIL